MHIEIFKGNPPEHIRKWMEEHAETGWNFDITKTGDYIAQKQLRDPAAYWCGNEDLNLYQFQVLDDNTLMFGTQAQGHPYIWKFEDSHPFEVEHLKDTYESKGSSTAYYKSAVLSHDGTKIFETFGSGVVSLYKTELTTPFDLTTAVYSERTKVFSNMEGTSNMGIFHLQFSPDGKTFIYKSYEGSVLKSVKLESPYDFSNIAESREQDLDQFFTGSKYAFFFSNNGRDAVFTSKVYGVSPEAIVTHVKLATPWDISTMQLVGRKSWYSSITPQAVAVNSNGTKMIVMLDRTFCEYDLVK